MAALAARGVFDFAREDGGRGLAAIELGADEDIFVGRYRITDETCAPDLSQPCHAQYVDNFIAISSDADHVKQSVTAAVVALEARGEFPEVPGEMIEQDWEVAGRFEWRKKGDKAPGTAASLGLAPRTGPLPRTPQAELRGPRAPAPRPGEGLAATSSRPASTGHSRVAALRQQHRVLRRPAASPAPLASSGPLRRKASQRAARGVARRAAAARVLGMTVLEAACIQPRARNRYQEIFRDFLSRANGRPLASEDLVDEAIAEWLDELHLDGEDLSAGSWAYAAVTFFAGLNKASGALMPRCRRALRGFRRLAPPRSRLPMPYMVVAMVVMELIAQHLVESALVVLLIFELRLRPGEAFHARAADLVPPVSDVSGASHWCATLHAAETEQESKTGEIDESLSLDLGRQSCLGPALNQFASQRLGANWRAAQQRCVGASHRLAAPLFTGDFKTVVEALGVHAALGAARVYMLRRGGASHDCASVCRRLGGARRRGRRRSWSSVRRYEKGGRLAQVAHKLAPALQARGKLCAELLSERVFVEVFSGGGHLSEAIPGAGVTALLWDISLGENYDLSYASSFPDSWR
ncbi:unnamed protein product [Prorocentrum cordatum]|uniref:Uncharacterized protein n=1 Tax=Prorocentrum cordatum TaxID=2364126 RepID=A0ABN9Q616_9DINO|nr:unnamed protein product [Polarella glacialis]